MSSRPHTFDALKDINYRRLWLGQIGTGMGQWMDNIARGWLVYSITHSPLHLGFVTAARGVPILLFSIVAGVVADRYSRRGQLIIAGIANAVFSCILATLVLTGKVEVWHIYVTAFLSGTATAFQQPARMVLINDLVGKDRLLNAVALTAAALNVSRGIGPALSGLLITYLGPAGSYYTEAAFYIWSAVLTVQVEIPEESKKALRRQAETRISFFGSAMEALRHVVSNRLILALMVLGLAPMVLAMPFTSLFPIFAIDILKVGAAGQGLLLSSVGAGAFLGAMGVATLGRNPRGKLLLLLTGTFGLSLVFFSHSPWMWFSMLTAFICGVANTAFNAQNQTIIQMLAPDHMRGRIVSVYLIDRGLTPVGTAWAGILANFLGGPNAIVVMGLSCVALTLGVAFLVPSVVALGSETTTASVPTTSPTAQASHGRKPPWR